MFVQRTPAEAIGLEPKVIKKFLEEANRWAEDKVNAFVKKRLSTELDSWEGIDEKKRFKKIDQKREHWHRHYLFDLDVVQASHKWMPSLDKALDLDERRAWLSFWREGLRIVIRRPSTQAGLHQHPHLYEDEQWIAQGVAAAIAHMSSDELPEEMWRAFVDLPKDAHHWTEDFLRYLHQHALSRVEMPKGYVSTVRGIVEYVLPENEKARRWPYHEDIWDALIGIAGYEEGYWDERHTGVVADLRDVFHRWFESAPAYAHRTARFARWLAKPAAHLIRLEALQWLVRGIEYGRRVEDRKEVGDAIALLLNTIWTQDERQLRRDGDAFNAFRTILRGLADQQNELALELLGRLGGLA